MTRTNHQQVSSITSSALIDAPGKITSITSRNLEPQMSASVLTLRKIFLDPTIPVRRRIEAAEAVLTFESSAGRC